MYNVLSLLKIKKTKSAHEGNEKVRVYQDTVVIRADLWGSQALHSDKECRHLCDAVGSSKILSSVSPPTVTISRWACPSSERMPSPWPARATRCSSFLLERDIRKRFDLFFSKYETSPNLLGKEKHHPWDSNREYLSPLPPPLAPPPSAALCTSLS